MKFVSVHYMNIEGEEYKKYFVQKCTKFTSLHCLIYVVPLFCIVMNLWVGVYLPFLFLYSFTYTQL